MSYLSGSKKLQKQVATWSVFVLAGVSSVVFAADAQETKKPTTFGAVPNFYTVPASSKETKKTVSSGQSAERSASNVKEFTVETKKPAAVNTASSRSESRTINASLSQQQAAPQQQASVPAQLQTQSLSTSSNAQVQQVTAAPVKQRGGYQVTFPNSNSQANFYTETTRTPASRVAGWNSSNEKMGVWKTASVSANALGSGVVHKFLHKSPSESRETVGKVEPLNAKVSKLNGTTQSGTASWYGGKWHGRKTANGERYDMNSLTAAHKTLPFGTLVKVTNERNGRSTVVRINNRGPYSKGRILDLSRAAASTLGFVSNGICKVKMEVVGRS